ncbi:MAG: hypothetical protein ACXVA9_11690, partial [Bdellovibrionales bacterium]
DLQTGSWGIWGLKSSAALNEKTQTEISASFHSLFSAIDSSEKREHDLAVLQERYEAVTSDLPSNVIPMFKGRTSPKPAFAKVRDKRWVLKQDCLIESLSLSDIHKMATELHEHSQRYAFMHYADLDRETRLNFSELISLGSISLFVPNILLLSSEEQEVLRQLATTETDDRPLLMVGANMAYSELRTEPTIHLEFLLLLSRAYIKLTRPFSEYKDKGLIHYFLDSLAQSPS